MYDQIWDPQAQAMPKKLESICNRSLREPGAPDVPGEVEGL